MSAKVPQHADIILSFRDITDGTGDPIDLVATDDIVLSISFKSASHDPIVELKNSINPELFEIDNVNKSVSVKLVSGQVGDVVGKYFTNLWIEGGGRWTTHLTQSFDVVPAVNR